MERGAQPQEKQEPESAGDDSNNDEPRDDAEINLEGRPRQKRQRTGKVYGCDFPGCHFSTDRRDSLNRHYLKHTSKGAYKCSWQGCTYRAHQNHSLVSHIRSHTGEKPYKCSYAPCTYAAATRSHMTEHKRVHTGEKPFVCDFPGCGASFSQQTNQATHTKSHYQREPTFFCPHPGCTYGSTRSYNVKRHLASHSDPDSPVSRLTAYGAVADAGLPAYGAKTSPEAADPAGMDVAPPRRTASGLRRSTANIPTDLLRRRPPPLVRGNSSSQNALYEDTENTQHSPSLQYSLHDVDGSLLALAPGLPVAAPYLPPGAVSRGWPPIATAHSTTTTTTTTTTTVSSVSAGAANPGINTVVRPAASPAARAPGPPNPLKVSPTSAFASVTSPGTPEPFADADAPSEDELAVRRNSRRGTEGPPGSQRRLGSAPPLEPSGVFAAPRPFPVKTDAPAPAAFFAPPLSRAQASASPLAFAQLAPTPAHALLSAVAGFVPFRHGAGRSHFAAPPGGAPHLAGTRSTPSSTASDVEEITPPPAHPSRAPGRGRRGERGQSPSHKFYTVGRGQ